MVQFNQLRPIASGRGRDHLMVARRIILSLLAFVFLSVTVIPIVHADGTDWGNGDDNEIHPWDNNDDFVVDTGPVLSALHRPIILLAEFYSGRGMVIWSSQSASRSLTNMHKVSTTQEARSTRRVIRLEAGKR